MKHTEIASELFSKRYYCSQAVLAAFAEELGMTKEQALRVGACFGGGMCKAEVCGACTGALMALGLKYGMCEDGDYESQQRANSQHRANSNDKIAKRRRSQKHTKAAKEVIAHVHHR